MATLLNLRPSDTIVDVGAGAGGSLAVFNDTNAITAVDRERWPNDPDRPNVQFVQGDGRELPFQDRSFDIAFCNSVLLYIPKEDRTRFADEIQRVADRYWVQIPSRWFPVDPHTQIPILHMLPVAVRRRLNRRVPLRWYARGRYPDYWLLSTRQLNRLFPDSQIYRERVLGITKSLAVYKNPS